MWENLRCKKVSSLLLISALLLTGCHHRYITCRSEYLYPRYLASDKINTPDPYRECFYGQQIIVQWNLPCPKPADIILKVRYGNREISNFSFSVDRVKGWKIYRLINEEYWCRGGIIAFQAQLLQEQQLIDTWTHYLWADIIHIETEDYRPLESDALLLTNPDRDL